MADSANQTIRKITPDGTVTTLAGIPGDAGSDDGPVATATFISPTGIAADGSGNLYVTSPFGLRMITKEGVLSTPAGGISPGGLDGIGVAATFNDLNGLAVDGAGAHLGAGRRRAGHVLTQ